MPPQHPLHRIDISPLGLTHCDTSGGSPRVVFGRGDPVQHPGSFDCRRHVAHSALLVQPVEHEFLEDCGVGLFHGVDGELKALVEGGDVTAVIDAVQTVAVAAVAGLRPLLGV